MNLKDMTKDERSLLLFFETQVVDYGGKVKTACMNKIDMGIAKSWNESGFIGFGRIRSSEIFKQRYPRTHWVELSEEAWKLAHQERRARVDRIMKQTPLDSIKASTK